MREGNYLDIALEKVVITWGKKNHLTSRKEATFRAVSGELCFSVITENLKGKVVWQEDDQNAIVVFGTPIVEDKIDHVLLAKKILENGQNEKYLHAINGSFLIFHFDKRSCILNIINDRFTGYPLYCFAKKDFFIGTFYYNDLFLFLHQYGYLDLYEEAFFEVLYFRRLLGTKTLDLKSFFLPAANLLSFNGSEVRLRRYWTQEYSKNHRYQLRENGERLALAIRKSIARKTSDGKRYGLFLSGGLDTRTILAAFPSPLVCFTATSRKVKNREYEIAHELSILKGSEHVHLPLPQNHYSSVMPYAVKLNGGVYTSMPLFLGFQGYVSPRVDVAFHGHGFDYMFQGMYIPANYLRPLSLPLAARRLKRVSSDVVSEFMFGVSYRVKYPFLFDFVVQGQRDRIKEFMHESVREIYRGAVALSENPYDQWEYLTFHFLSRHYSYPDHASINTNAEQRAISFDNDIYDLYLSMPVEHRFDARVQRAALELLGHSFAEIPSANDGLPITSSYVKSLYQLKSWAQILLNLKKRNRAPDHHIRTWATARWLLMNEKYFRDEVSRLWESPALTDISWIDRDALRNTIEMFYRNPGMRFSNYLGDALWGLLNLELFLRQMS